jgi:hypothetical protein
MTLKEKFDNVEIMFENQVGSLKYDELSEASNQCEKIADEFAIGFAEWISMRCYITKDNSYWLIRNEGDIKKNPKELLIIYKKEKGL